MIVTASTAHREAKPDGGGGFDAVDHVFDEELFGERAALGVLAVVAVEGGGENLLVGRVGQHVSGELLDGELIERHVVVIGFDDPVPPGPVGAFGVLLKTIGVRVAGAVEPAERLSFGIVERGEGFIDKCFVGCLGIALESSCERFGLRKQSCQGERSAAQARFEIGFGLRGEFLFFQS